MRKQSTVPAAAVLAVIFSESAVAYVGPGAGLSLIGALWGLLAAVVAALGFIVLWPLRRIRRQRTARRAAEDESGRRKGDRSIDDDTGHEPS